MLQERLKPSDPYPQTQATIQLPHTNTFLTAETSKAQLAQTYGEIAAHLSQDRETAETLYILLNTRLIDKKATKTILKT